MRKSIFLVIVISMLFSGCKKDTEVQPLPNNGSTPTDTVATESVDTTFTPDEFPVSVGNWWKYRVVDGNYDTIDTLTVTVSQEIDTVGAKKYICVLTQDGAVVDSGKFMVNADSLSYEGLRWYYSYFGDFKLKFPFTGGVQWPGFFPPDTVLSVARVDSVTLMGITYSPVFTLKRSFTTGINYSLTQFMMITPNVGVVMQSVDLFNYGNVQSQNFMLIDYHVE